MNYLLQEFNLENRNKNLDFSAFRVGYELCVSLKINQGASERIKKISGICISKNKRAMNFTLLILSEKIEITFNINSKNLVSIEKTRINKVKRAKLNYLKNISGKKNPLKQIYK